MKVAAQAPEVVSAGMEDPQSARKCRKVPGSAVAALNHIRTTETLRTTARIVFQDGMLHVIPRKLVPFDISRLLAALQDTRSWLQHLQAASPDQPWGCVSRPRLWGWGGSGGGSLQGSSKTQRDPSQVSIAHYCRVITTPPTQHAFQVPRLSCRRLARLTRDEICAIVGAGTPCLTNLHDALASYAT